jgi:purine nucleosidase
MPVKYPQGTVPKTLERFALRVAFFLALSVLAPTQEGGSTFVRQKIIVDTDIGGDIDDAFALALALSSPDMELLGVTTA